MLKNKTVSRLFWTIFCLFACITLSYAESCSRIGTTQNKYTASGCSYTTQTRTCCGNYQWSEWGKDCTCNYNGQGCDDWQIYADWDPVACKCICPANATEVNGVCECNPGYEERDHECVKGDEHGCISRECWNGSKCEAKGPTTISCVERVQETTGGTLTRTATCYPGSGWRYGYWKGTCTCPSGSTWTGSGEGGRCEGNYIWQCDHGYIVSYNGCSGYHGEALRGYPCSNKGETGTAYEDIGGGECETASCVCE